MARGPCGEREDNRSGSDHTKVHRHGDRVLPGRERIRGDFVDDIADRRRNEVVADRVCGEPCARAGAASASAK